MTGDEQLAWCIENRATVWFSQGKVSVQVKDMYGATKASSLLSAIVHIEKVRAERKLIGEALDSLNMRAKERGAASSKD